MTRFIENPQEFPTGENTFLLDGAVGKLEILTNMPASICKDPIAVICHPHPLFGGTMHNKVVHTIARAFKEMNIRTIRFNFRGVGASIGEYANGIGETDDLFAILQWLKQIAPDTPIWLAGFSFGSYVAARAAKMWPIAQLISVAPPIENFDFKGLPPFTCPWLVIQGDQDEVVAPEIVFAWLDNLANSENPPNVIRMAESSHFFHGKLIELRQLLINYINQQLI